jgi:hypothetical protein
MAKKKKPIAPIYKVKTISVKRSKSKAFKMPKISSGKVKSKLW